MMFQAASVLSPLAMPDVARCDEAVRTAAVVGLYRRVTNREWLGWSAEHGNLPIRLLCFGELNQGFNGKLQVFWV